MTAGDPPWWLPWANMPPVEYKPPFPYLMPGDPPPTLADLEKLLDDARNTWAEAMADVLMRRYFRPVDLVNTRRVRAALIYAFGGGAVKVAEDLRWRRTIDEPPPWRKRVLTRTHFDYQPAGVWWYDVTTYERRPYAPFKPGWRGDCGWGEPDHYEFWRPLP